MAHMVCAGRDDSLGALKVKGDRYHSLGAKRRVTDFDDALIKVREHFPKAYAEGSTGPERTFWVRQDPDNPFDAPSDLVAHFWKTPVKVHNVYFVRIKGTV